MGGTMTKPLLVLGLILGFLLLAAWTHGTPSTGSASKADFNRNDFLSSDFNV